MNDAPLWAAYSGIVLVILMAGVLAGYMIARAAGERREYDAEIAGYEDTLAARRRPRHARPTLQPLPPELEAPKRPAPAFHTGPIPAAWPRTSRVLVIAAGSHRSRYPLEDTGRMAAFNDAGEVAELEVITTANIDAMRAENAAWLEAWSKVAP